MPTENKVFTKLFSDKKVELSLQDEIEDQIKDMVNRFEDYTKIVDDRLETGVRYESLKNKEYELAQGLLDERLEVKEKIEEFKRKAEDLGFTPDLSIYEGGLTNLENEIKFASGGLGLKF